MEQLQAAVPELKALGALDLEMDLRRSHKQQTLLADSLATTLALQALRRVASVGVATGVGQAARLSLQRV